MDLTPNCNGMLSQTCQLNWRPLVSYGQIKLVALSPFVAIVDSVQFCTIANNINDFHQIRRCSVHRYRCFHQLSVSTTFKDNLVKNLTQFWLSFFFSKPQIIITIQYYIKSKNNIVKIINSSLMINFLENSFLQLTTIMVGINNKYYIFSL